MLYALVKQFYKIIALPTIIFSSRFYPTSLESAADTEKIGIWQD